MIEVEAYAAHLSDGKQKNKIVDICKPLGVDMLVKFFPERLEKRGKKLCKPKKDRVNKGRGGFGKYQIVNALECTWSAEPFVPRPK